MGYLVALIMWLICGLIGWYYIFEHMTVEEKKTNKNSDCILSILFALILGPIVIGNIISQASK